MRNRSRLLAVAFVLGLVAAGCGQYEGVHDRAYFGNQAAGAPVNNGGGGGGGGTDTNGDGIIDPGTGGGGGTDTNGDGIIDPGTGGGGTDTNGDGIIDPGTGGGGDDPGGGGDNPGGGGDDPGGGGDDPGGGGDDPGGGGDDPGGGGDDPGGGGDDPGGGGDDPGGGGDDPGGGGDDPGGGGDDPGGGGDDPGGGGDDPPPGSGWGDTIVIGIHAPITGAAPLAVNSFQTQKDLYWRYANDGGPVTVHGRSVEVVVEDDQYNPSVAQSKCRDMVERDGAFILIGGAGVDQIVACAQYTAGIGVPYMSGGTNEQYLGQFGNYFAVTMTYPQQAPLLADYIHAAFTQDCTKVKMIAEDTPNFDDAVAAFEAACPGVVVQRVGKSDNGGGTGAQLCTASIPVYEAVYVLHAPLYFLQVANGAKSCQPDFVGVGISMGINIVANNYCQGGGQTGKLHYFSPGVAFQETDDYDPRFRAAAADAGVAADDIGWLLWGLNQGIHAALLDAGPNLTQEGFMSTTENSSSQFDGFTDAAYTPDNHFGGKQVNLLENVCQGASGFFVTKAAERSSF